MKINSPKGENSVSKKLPTAAFVAAISAAIAGCGGGSSSDSNDVISQPDPTDSKTLSISGVGASNTTGEFEKLSHESVDAYLKADGSFLSNFGRTDENGSLDIGDDVKDLIKNELSHLDDNQVVQIKVGDLSFEPTKKQIVDFLDSTELETIRISDVTALVFTMGIESCERAIGDLDGDNQCTISDLLVHSIATHDTPLERLINQMLQESRYDLNTSLEEIKFAFMGELNLPEQINVEAGSIGTINGEIVTGCDVASCLDLIFVRDQDGQEVPTTVNNDGNIVSTYEVASNAGDVSFEVNFENDHTGEETYYTGIVTVNETPNNSPSFNGNSTINIEDNIGNEIDPYDLTQHINNCDQSNCEGTITLTGLPGSLRVDGLFLRGNHDAIGNETHNIVAELFDSSGNSLGTSNFTLNIHDNDED